MERVNYSITSGMHFYFCEENNPFAIAKEDSYLNFLTYSLLRNVFLLLLIIAVLSDKCLAQEGSKKIDSLTEVLRTQKEDSNKVKTLNALSRQLWQKSNYAEAKIYADKALALADSIVFDKGKVDAYNNIGIIFARKGNNAEGLKNHNAGLRKS